MSAAQRRSHAKAAVTGAGLALLKIYVDRAERLFADGEVTEVVIDALQQEFGARALRA
jgi:hypothetical protein